LAVDSYDRAIECFEQASGLDPEYAESYHQRSVAHFFLGQWKRSIHASAKAIKLNPEHFGAIAGLGHSYAQLGQFDLALRCYRQALRINPYMRTIAAATRRMEKRVADTRDASGEFLVDTAFGLPL